MKGRIGFLRTLLFSTVVLMVMAPLANSQAQGADCRYLVAGRTYAHAFGGFLNSELFPLLGLKGQFPTAGVGTFSFHRNGSVTGSTGVKVGPIDVIEVPMVNATYKLSWDTSKSPVVCTGTMKTDVPLSPTGTENWQLVVREMGNGIELIHTDFGLTVGITTIHRQEGRCNNRTLHATYTYNAKGWTLPPPMLPPPIPAELLNGFMPFAFSGAIQFRPELPPPGTIPNAPEGSAYLEGWDTVSLNGFITPRTYVGWYKVNSDCSAQMALLDNIGNPLIHTNVIILKGADQIDVLNTDVPLVVAFTAERQR